MGRQFNVLVFPGGTEIGLEINRALGSCKDVKLYSCGLAISNHAPYVYSSHYCVPSIRESGWIDSLNKVIEMHSIDYVFPAYDDVLVALVENAHLLRAQVVSSPAETCLITRSKLQTYRCLDGIIPVPSVYNFCAEIQEFPVFVKPDNGQGSQGARMIRDSEELRYALKMRPDSIILEYLPGEEYTIDCFTSRQQGLLFCGGRQRVRTRNGISMESKPISDERFTEYAKAISSRLVFHGSWFFQLKKDRRGCYKLLEIAPRIAGTMALHRVQGINFPLLSLYEQEGIPIRIMRNPEPLTIDRSLANRYAHNISYDTAYIDLDDTLILNGKVNVLLIRLLYQCLNRGIKIVLLTKHGADLQETLRSHRLSEIFDEVILVERGAKKSDYISSSRPILIDDSFSERMEVHQELAIPTFDCTMLEVLLDDRA